MTENAGAAIELPVFIRLRDGAVTDDIDLTDSYRLQDMIRSVGQLG